MQRNRMAFAATLGLLAAAATTSVQADSREGSTMTRIAPVKAPAAVTLDEYRPAGYRDVSRRSVDVDGQRAELVRYERADGRNAGIGGEHFSTVIDADGRLKGFARMDLDLVGGTLPTQDEARGIAMDFLANAAPDLLPALKISWIDRHDEPLLVARGDRTETLTLTGMKVKMRNTADGRWMWVVVGADRKVMVFERDIVWVTFPGHRKTEKWLHDAWLVEEGHAERAS